MKTHKTINVKKEVVDTIICNCCGKPIQKWNNNIPLEDVKESVEVSAEFGYFTKIFLDGERHDIDVCEACYANWIKTFKHAPTGFGTEGGYDIEVNFDEWKLSK